MFVAYYIFDRDDDGVSINVGAGGFHSDDVDDRPIDSDNSEDELDDGDFLSQLLCHTKAEVLAASAGASSPCTQPRRAALAEGTPPPPRSQAGHGGPIGQAVWQPIDMSGPTVSPLLGLGLELFSDFYLQCIFLIHMISNLISCK